jgi:pyruvate ferredoxin oxidoreductase gamma subunit
MVEIRWHARGGQGAVTASKILASAVIREGKFAQSNPDYGAERAGAPLRAYNRVSEEPITLHCMVTEPDVVVIVDPTLMKTASFLEGTGENTILIVNTDKEPKALREELGIKGRKIYTVNATKIAMEELGRQLTNIPMLGALVKILKGLVDIEAVEEDIRKTFGKKLSKDVLEANIRALYRAYKEVRSE